jgi:hypothetical protein
MKVCEFRIWWLASETRSQMNWKHFEFRCEFLIFLISDILDSFRLKEMVPYGSCARDAARTIMIMALKTRMIQLFNKFNLRKNEFTNLSACQSHHLWADILVRSIVLQYSLHRARNGSKGAGGTNFQKKWQNDSKSKQFTLILKFEAIKISNKSSARS